MSNDILVETKRFRQDSNKISNKAVRAILAVFPFAEVMPVIQFIVGLIVGIVLTVFAIGVWAVLENEDGDHK